MPPNESSIKYSNVSHHAGFRRFKYSSAEPDGEYADTPPATISELLQDAAGKLAIRDVGGNPN